MVYVLHLYHSVTLIPDEDLTTKSNIYNAIPQQITIQRTILEQNAPFDSLSLSRFILQHFSTSLSFINFQNIANVLIMLVYSFACVCPPALQTEPLRLLTKYLSLIDT